MQKHHPMGRMTRNLEIGAVPHKSRSGSRGCRRVPRYSVRPRALSSASSRMGGSRRRDEPSRTSQTECAMRHPCVRHKLAPSGTSPTRIALSRRRARTAWSSRKTRGKGGDRVRRRAYPWGPIHCQPACPATVPAAASVDVRSPRHDGATHPQRANRVGSETASWCSEPVPAAPSALRLRSAETVPIQAHRTRPERGTLHPKRRYVCLGDVGAAIRPAVPIPGG